MSAETDVLSVQLNVVLQITAHVTKTIAENGRQFGQDNKNILSYKYQ
jgi:hypothetical protein